MNSILNKNYIIFYIIVGLVLHLISVYFAFGFYSDDEHFQILEPTAYLLGLNEIVIEDTTGYYWEWRSHIRMRPWFQPYIYYHFINFLKFIGLQDPFNWTLVIRLISSTLGYLSVIYLFFTIKNDFFKKNTHFNYLIFFSFWFYPFLHSRTSAENLSIIFFVFSFCLLYKQLFYKEYKTNYFIFFVASFLMGLSMVTKFNLVFTTLPFFIWIFFYRFNFFKLLIFGISTLLALGLGLFIDFINWGSYKNTYLQFYKFNLDETWGRLKDFGPEPWHYFISETILQLAPLLSIFFVLGIIIFWLKKPNHPLTWVTFFTVFICSFFSHKEIRYIFPVYIFAPLFIAFFFEKYNFKYFSNIFKSLIIFSNIMFLVLTLFVPPNTKVGVYKFVFKNISEDEKIYYLNENPYLVNNMEPFIYTKFLPKINEYKEGIELKNIWIITNKFEDIKYFSSSNCNVEYTTYPEFIFSLNQNWKRLNLNWYILSCK